jgi:hypothetical protein
MKIEEALKNRVDQMRGINYPAILEHTVLAKGVKCKPARLPHGIKRGVPRHCFMNAYRLAAHYDLTYVEGFGIPMGLEGFAVLHAWCVNDFDEVVDPTWDHPEHNQYLGIKFTQLQMASSMMRTGCYGLLDTGRGVNMPLVLEVYPEISEYIKSFGL